MPGAAARRRLLPASKVVPGALAVYDWQFWDSEQITAAVTTGNEFFVNVAGKDFFRTNMQQGAQLPPPYVFHAYTVSVLITSINTVATGGADVAFGQVSAADNLLTAMISVLEDSRLDLRVSAKNNLEAPLTCLPAGGGVYAIHDRDNAAAAAIAVDFALDNGTPSPAHCPTYPWPIVIKHNENFSARVTWGHVVDIGGFPATPLMFVFLKGILMRGIQ